MGLEPLAQAPPKLYELFPSFKTLEDKAFRFLETFYELGSYRRTAKKLKIDPKTVKSINEFLMNTDVGQRFNALLIEQTEDFYSAKTLTSLFEGWHKEIARVEDSIKIQEKIVKLAMDSDDVKDGVKIKSVSDAEVRKLKLIAEKRMWMTKLLDASLSCRPISKAVDKERKKDDIKTSNQERDSLLSDFGSNESGDNPGELN